MIHIAYCFDKNYQQHFGASLTSLLLNFGDDGADLTIHVVTDEVDTAFGQKLNWFKRRFRAHVEVRLLKSADMRELVDLPTQTAMVSHTTPATWFRLLLPNILPADIERLIYLDPDTIVLSDISELFHADSQGAPLAAILDYSNTRMSAMYELKNYVNSGVLLMDLQEWRDKDYGTLCLEHARRTRDEHLFTDQCAINTFFAERILLLEKKWNRFVVPNERNPELRDTAVLHFITADKPWHSWYENSLSKHYWKYIDVSPWAGAMPVPPTYIGKALRLARLRHVEGKSSESIQLYERILAALGQKV